WQFPEAEALMAESERLARASNDHAGRVELATLRCRTCVPTASFEVAIDALGESVEIERRLGLKAMPADTPPPYSYVLTLLTRFDEAWSAAQEGLQIASGEENLLVALDIDCYQVPVYHLRNGDLEAARAAAESAMEAAARIGFAFAECYGAFHLAE